MTDLEPERVGVGADATDFALDGGLVANQEHGGAELAGRGGGALHDHSRAVVTPHGVDRDLHAGGSSASTRPRAALRAFHGNDFAALVVPAVRAHAVWQLRLPTLGTERARRGGELVVGAALAAARLAV